jgi:hypothetical protein
MNAVGVAEGLNSIRAKLAEAKVIRSMIAGRIRAAA